MYEIWAKGATPYKDIQSVTMVHAMVTNGFRLLCHEDCPADVHALMLECWHANPVRRPSFPEVETKLNALISMC